MPSWYNLFLATAGIACLRRYTRDRRARWLLLAGAAGGVSILFKIVGLYYVAGALLFLLWLETTEEPTDRPGENASYRVFAALACTVLAICALYVVATGGGRASLLHFGLPPLAAVTTVAVALLHPTGRRSADRFTSLARTVAPLLAGVAVPVAAFLIPYVASGSLPALYRGVFVLPRTRLEFEAVSPLPVLGFLPAIALVAWVASRSRAAFVAGGAILLVAVGMTHIDVVYRIVWWTLISLGPVAAMAGAWHLSRSVHAAPRAKAGGVLVLAIFAFANLVQLPFSIPLYFLYSAPLLVLLGVALGGIGTRRQPCPLLLLTTALCAFFVLRVDAGFINHLGFRYRPHEETAALALPRARGIRVDESEKAEIEQLVAGLDRIHPGGAILAIPDAPEVYYLSGRPNPTRTLFDVFDDPATRTERVLTLVDSAHLRVVVINRASAFDQPFEAPLLDSLRVRLRFRAEVGRFVILWAGPGDGASTAR
ncbi:MAG: phospholipid carrier-dependent glycosyltransferase [Gemmatimonadetes bacterium]|nr:phospholipid carrier-dependent glycosyltransferase [Gemmatimonadota bacterium]